MSIYICELTVMFYHYGLILICAWSLTYFIFIFIFIFATHKRWLPWQWSNGSLLDQKEYNKNNHELYYCNKIMNL